MLRPAPSRRRIIGVLVVVAIAVVVAIGLLQSTGSSSDDPQPPSLAEAQAAVAGAPPPLRRLYARDGRLIDLSPKAFKRELRELRGHPVVINVWAQWCDPCRAEFPLLRTAAARHGAKVAFLGLNVDREDARDRAQRFLEEQPTVYPSFTDPTGVIARGLEVSLSAMPSTVFLDADGRIVTVRQGTYADVGQLERDLRLYAGPDGQPAPGSADATSARSSGAR